MHLNGTAKRPITVGLVGLGYWGPNLLRVLADLDEVEVKWICDLDLDRLARFGRRYPSTCTTDNFGDLLADPELEAVLIATPVFSHFGLASAVLRAGKHCFVEKPLAPSVAEADELIAIAEAEGRRLMCGQTFLYSPAVRHIKRMIESGELGDLYFISASRVNLGLHQRDVSVIWDLGPHDFSILRYWLGESPTSVAATGRASIVKGIPDVSFVNLEYPSGLIAHVELSWLAPSKLRRTAIVGSEKMVVYEDGAPEPIRVFDSGVIYNDPESFGEYHLSYRTGDIVSPRLPATEPIALELRDFARLIREGAGELDNLAIAREVVFLAESAELSLSRAGVPVDLRPAAV